MLARRRRLYRAAFLQFLRREAPARAARARHSFGAGGRKPTRRLAERAARDFCARLHAAVHDGAAARGSSSCACFFRGLHSSGYCTNTAGLRRASARPAT